MITAAKSLDIGDESDIVTARKLGKDIAKDLGFSSVDQVRIATSISELARNVVRYAVRGIITFNVVRATNRTGLEIICEDNGPGIADVEEVIEGEHISELGLGLGLAGTKRLMDDFEIASQLGAGTIVTIRKWL